jgi:hypothetical protein
VRALESQREQLGEVKVFGKGRDRNENNREGK